MAIGDKKPVVMEGDIGNLVPPKLHAPQHAADGSDPITPDMIGAVPYIGFVTQDIFDNLAYEQSYTGWIGSDTTNVPRAGYWNVLYLASSNGNHGTQFVFGMNHQEVWFRQALTQGNNGTWKELATTDYAVNKAGDTMTGKLYAAGGITITGGRLSHTDGDNGFYIADWADGGKEITLELNAANVKATLNINTGSGVTYNTILHTGNKPSGSYTGNGDATERTIDTGGIGHVVMVNSSYGAVIITPSGGITIQGSVTTGINYSGVHCANGVITLATTSELLNKSGITYTYQVL